MATDPRCVVEVGVHPGPFFRRRSDGAGFCTRHAEQMVEAEPWLFGATYEPAGPEEAPRG